MPDPHSVAHLRAALSSSGTELWLFRSSDPAFSRLEGSAVEELEGARPGALAGVSVIAVSNECRASTASSVLELRIVAPTLPLVCFVPPPKDALDLEVVRLCGALGARLAYREFEPRSAGACVEEVLRVSPLKPALDFLEFLERRGHPVRTSKKLTGLFHQLSTVKSFEAVGPRNGETRRAWLRRARRALRGLGLPPPRGLTTIVRLTMAGIRLYSSDRPSVARVAEDLGFSSPFDLSNQMVRHFRERPGRVRGLYPWEWMLDRALPAPPSRWRPPWRAV